MPLLTLFVMLLGTSVNALPIAAEALKAHNQVRAQDKQKPLVWSADLTQISQQWADRLASSCKVYHHQGELPFGENLFYKTQNASATEVVRTWAHEKSFITINKISVKQVNSAGITLRWYGRELPT